MQDDLDRIFSFLLGDLVNLNVYFHVDDESERDYSIEDHSVFVSAENLVSFL